MAKTAKKAKKIRKSVKEKPTKKKKSSKKKQKLVAVNGETGEKTTYEKEKGKKVKLVDHTKESKWHKEATGRLAELKAQIKTANKQVGEGVHGIGCCLKLVRDDKLFKIDGAASFGEWVDGHADFSRMTAYNMIAVAEHLTRKDAGKYGPTLSYTLAKTTDDAARKELRLLVQKGASPTEVERERFRQLKERDQSTLPPRKRSRGTRTVKRAVGVHGGGGTEAVEVDEKEVKRSAKARAREESSVERGEVGTFDLKPIKVTKDKKKFKSGWTHAVPKMQIGENGPVVRIEVNMKKELVKFRVL